MDNPEEKAICQPSAGVHIVLPDYYSPEGMGLLDPNTSDGRVIFFLPWMKYTVAGTTDSPCPVTEEPQPTERVSGSMESQIKWTQITSTVAHPHLPPPSSPDSPLGFIDWPIWSSS